MVWARADTAGHGYSQVNVLIGAETSGRVREAFRALGHDAYSTDLLPADDNSPYHVQGDILDILGPRWDLLVVHLPCTYLCNSGVWAYHKTPPNPSPGVKYGPARWDALDQALSLWERVRDCGIPKIAMENPVPHKYAAQRIGRPMQTIQPYQFGDDASKRTGLWLYNLPQLVLPPKEAWVAPRLVAGKPRWGNQTDGGQNKLPPSADRWKLRSTTYPGIANAFAAQWGGRC